jgi:hypothetical protein
LCNKKIIKNICYFCGVEGADTKEDIPPKCFFPKGQRDGIIKVPAHLSCNQDWEDAIEYFRNLFSGLSPYNSIAKSLFKTKGKRSLIRNYPLRTKMLSELRNKIDIYSRGGIFLKSQPGVQVDSNLTCKLVNHITRGLYYHHKDNVLPKESEIKWKVQPIDSAPKWIQSLPTTIIHPKIFRYRYAIIDKHPEWSTWLLGFYDLSIGTILAITGNEKLSE